MFLTGTILNVVAVLIGTTLGVLLGARVPERMQRTLTDGLGLFTIAIGLALSLRLLLDRSAPVGNDLAVLAALLAGSALGELLRLSDHLDALGDWFQRKLARGDQPSRVSEAFVTASLVFCVGPLTILGSIQNGLTGDIQLLGATGSQLFFLCDQRVTVIDRAILGQLAPGLYSYQGLRIDGLAIDGDEGSWNHERFNSVLFLDEDNCVTLGFALGGSQRDDVILESYRIYDGRIQREAIATTDHDLDLPIWQFSALSDGSLVFASERYWHSFIWREPRRGVDEVEMLAGAAVGNNEFGNWFRKSAEGDEMTFVARDPAVSTVMDASGDFGSMYGDFHLAEGMYRLDADDFTSARLAFAGLEIEDAAGRLARWHCDVEPKWMFARSAGDYVVFKNSGPVVVRRRNDW